jgi:hypothetical protein
MSQLSELKINIKLKLSALWASVGFLYIYCDYFELYIPNKIEGMINGTTIFGAGDQGALLGLSSIMLVTSLMICFSVLLPANINRVLNILIGFIMTLMQCYIAFIAGWYFYKMYAIVEATLTLIIIWHAWNWPKESNVE